MKKDLLIQGLLAALFFLILLFLTTMGIMIFESTANADTKEFVCNTEECADAMIKYWVRLAPRHPMANPKHRIKLARLQVAATKAHGTPLALATAIMVRESSCRSRVKGTRGELGLMQVHPATAVRFKCRLVKPYEQLLCGNKVLRYWYNKCGNWRCALTAYASKTGAFKAKPGSNLARVVNDRFKLATELENIGRSSSMNPEDAAHPLE
jgi:soluble lytic murein transglycosylase-like protein